VNENVAHPEDSTNKRRKQAKPKTIHNDVVVIKQLVNFAVQRRMIAANPLAGLKLELPKRTPQPFWTRDQVDRILANANSTYRPLFQFLADTGCRIGEAVWLTWPDVDFDNNVVHIQPKEGWRPKTGDSRVIPMSANLAEVLRGRPRTAKWVFTAEPSLRRPAGRQVSDRRALAHVKVVLKRLKLKGHLHTFRHSFISHALTSNIPEAIVRNWVGHVDPEIIRVYTHIADKQSHAGIELLFPKTGGTTASDLD
jgi:integrase